MIAPPLPGEPPEPGIPLQLTPTLSMQGAGAVSGPLQTRGSQVVGGGPGGGAVVVGGPGGGGFGPLGVTFPPFPGAVVGGGPGMPAKTGSTG